MAQGDTFVPYQSKKQSTQDFANSLFNTEKAREYGNVFDQGYQNLGQPLHDNSNRNDVYVGGTRALATAFADSVYKKTGQLPTEDQVKNFVAQNLTQGFAQKFITGLPQDQITALADQHVNDNPDQFAAAGQQTPQDRVLGLNKQLDEAYSRGSEDYVNKYDQNVYNPSKTKTANDLAGQGMLTQPNSRYSLDAIEANRGRDISSGLNTLASERAKGSVGLGTTIEGLLQSQQGINNQKSQFNQQFQAAQDKNIFDQGLQNRSLDIAGQIGKLQAGGQSNNGFAGALGGATSGAVAGTGTGGPGWGTAIGGLIGGLGGYFGTKR